MQIVVLGVHRSGTSVLTRLVNMIGCYVGTEGSTVGFHDENLKGYWERHDVMALNDDILAHYDCRWDDLLQWDANSTNPLPEVLEHRIKQIIHELDHHRPWVIKDPRLCQTFKHWKEHLEVPQVVIAWRDPIEVALSLHKRGISYQHALAIWEHCTLGIFRSTAELHPLIVKHEDLLKTPYAVTQKIYDWLLERGVHGIHMPSIQEVNTFIDPALYRAKYIDAPEIMIPKEILSLTDWLQKGEGGILNSHLSYQGNQAFELAHALRCVSDQLNAEKQFNELQANRIRELEGLEQKLLIEIKALNDRPAWELQQSDWIILLERINRFEEETRGAIEHIKHSGLFGRLKFYFNKLLG